MRRYWIMLAGMLLTVSALAAPEALLVNGRAQVPLRTVAEWLGAKVTYEAPSRKITLEKFDRTVTLLIGGPTAWLDKQSIALDSPAMVRDGVTYVPVRFVAESLAGIVYYDKAAGVITIRNAAGDDLALYLGKDSAHRAAVSGDPAKVLAAARRNPGALATRDRWGNTPLHRAIEEKEIDVATVLVWQGADVNVARGDGRAPLHLAAARGYAGLVRSLLEYDADVHALDNQGNTPLHYAANETTVGLLLNRGALANTRNTRAETPLHLAAKSHDAQRVLRLLDGGAAVAARDAGGCMPLHLAALSGGAGPAGQLIVGGAQVDARTTTGATALHFAAKSGNVPVARVLLNSGADPNARADDGSLPLALAKAGGHWQLADLLRRAGAKE